MKNKLSLLAILMLVAAPLAFAMPVRAISAMSVTGTGITANSSAITTAITPTVNFTTAVGQVIDGNTIQVIFNGMTVSGAGLVAADITLTGCSVNTLEAAPGTDANGAHEVTITNGATGNNDPIVLITLDSTAGPVAPSCPAGAYTVAIAASEVSSRTAAGNYGISITTSAEGAGFLYYVGDENDVQVTASVDPTLTFVIRNTADTANQPNVNGAAVGPNLCDLGNLSNVGVQTCDYRLKVTTNSSSGYSVNIATDGSLRKGTDFINNVAEGTTVTGGTEGYGVAFNGGSYDPDGALGGFTPTACTETADFDDDDTPTATALLTGVNQTLYTCAGPNNPEATDLTNTALVTHRAEADSSTPAGTYVQLVTYTASATY
jgi:hypothetical protein